MKRALIASTLVIALAACATAGRDFERVNAEQPTPGVATRAEVLQRMGPPHRIDNVVFNSEALESAGYVYVAVGSGTPLEPGVVPARSVSYFFRGDRLVGRTFSSSFQVDHTRFDETRLSQIVKGRTRRDDVVQLLGKPPGTALAPIARPPATEVLIYAYTANRGANRITSRVARIGIDGNGVVEYVETQNRDPS